MIDIAELTRELVMIPSESSDPTATPAAAEAGMVRHLQKLCRRHHVSCETLTVKEGRDNLVVRWRAPGRPRLVIMAHMDTVSARGMAEPFSAWRDEDGKIHGRGACDDKGPLACAFATVIGLIREGARPRFDLTLAATVDEEVSMAGAAAMAASGESWDLAIALEPTSLKVITAHKGACRFRITTSGRAAHSSAPERGDNAVYKMLPVIEDLRRYGETLARREDAELGRPTLTVTRISGGSSLNIIPDACEIGLDIRILPGMEPDEIAAGVEKAVAGRGRVEELYRGEGMKTDPELPLVREFLAALEKSGVAPETITAPFATDCSRLAHLCPCLVWGPGDIRLAHRSDEHINASELETAAAVLKNFLVQQ